MFERKVWNLWIDDMRDPAEFLSQKLLRMFPEFDKYRGFTSEDFIWAKDAAGAMQLVRAFGPPKFMALDHDLGDHTVFEFLKWLAKEHPDSPPAWKTHSANPNGVDNINAFMSSWHRSNT